MPSYFFLSFPFLFPQHEVFKVLSVWLPFFPSVEWKNGNLSDLCDIFDQMVSGDQMEL